MRRDEGRDGRSGSMKRSRSWWWRQHPVNILSASSLRSSRQPSRAFSPILGWPPRSSSTKPFMANSSQKFDLSGALCFFGATYGCFGRDAMASAFFGGEEGVLESVSRTYVRTSKKATSRRKAGAMSRVCANLLRSCGGLKRERELLGNAGAIGQQAMHVHASGEGEIPYLTLAVVALHGCSEQGKLDVNGRAEAGYT